MNTLRVSVGPFRDLEIERTESPRGVCGGGQVVRPTFPVAPHPPYPRPVPVMDGHPLVEGPEGRFLEHDRDPPNPEASTVGGYHKPWVVKVVEEGSVTRAS